MSEEDILYIEEQVRQIYKTIAEMETKFRDHHQLQKMNDKVPNDKQLNDKHLKKDLLKKNS